MDILKYKDYEGTAELDMSRGVCRGKILFITDLVTYESASPVDLQAEFEAAVDDYLETCIALGREAQKPLSGSFNIRISPALHKQARLRAVVDNTSLNEVVVRSLDCYLNIQPELADNYLNMSLDRAMRQASSHITQRILQLHQPIPVPEPYDLALPRRVEHGMGRNTIAPSKPYPSGTH